MMEVAQFEHTSGQRVGSLDVADLVGLAQHRTDLATILAAEVTADALAKIGCLSDVQHLAAHVVEQVDAWSSWQRVGELQLGDLRMTADLWQQLQVIESEDTKVGGALEEHVQQIGGRKSIIECTVAWLMIESEATGQCRQAAVGYLVADQSSGKCQGVDDDVCQVRTSGAGEGSVQKSNVEPNVVTNDHAVSTKLEQAGKGGLDARCRHDHGVGDSGEDCDQWRNCPARVDQGLECAEALAAADLDRTDFGDDVGVSIAACGFQVDDAERDVAQWCSQVVERTLHPDRRPRTFVRCQERLFDWCRRSADSVAGTIIVVTDGDDATEVEPIQTLDLPSVPDAALRSALEFAVMLSAAAHKRRLALDVPAGIKPYLKVDRLDAGGLRNVRRALVDEPSFRAALRPADVSGLVDEIGAMWLSRPDGWEVDIRRLVETARSDAAEKSTKVALRKEIKRREAAEQTAARSVAEAIVLREAVARETRLVRQAQARAAEAIGQVAALRDEIAGLHLKTSRLRAARDAEVGRAVEAESLAAAMIGRLGEVERIRDELLAGRHDPSGAPVEQSAAIQPTRLRSTRTPRRRPIQIPGGLYDNSVAAVDHVLRVPGVCVIVDGYNVAKLAWPNLELIAQRECCIDLLEDLARRLGTDLRIVFDGANVVGAASRRRLVRVQFSPAGVSADDVIRDEARALPVTTPLVVVTNDRAIATDVRAVGANIVSSDALLAAAGRNVPRRQDDGK